MQAILEAHFIFSANDGLRILSRLLDTEPVKAQHGNYRTAVVEYMERVVQDRNILGHQILTPEGRPVAVAAGDGKEIRLDEMRELRCRLLDLRTEFRGLLRALRP